MKKNVIVALFGTLVIAAFAFNGISFKPTSLKELKAQGQFICTPNTSEFCPTPDGSKVLSGYEIS
jgi:hypothetical protein